MVLLSYLFLAHFLQLSPAYEKHFTGLKFVGEFLPPVSDGEGKLSPSGGPETNTVKIWDIFR